MTLVEAVSTVTSATKVSDVQPKLCSTPYATTTRWGTQLPLRMLACVAAERIGASAVSCASLTGGARARSARHQREMAHACAERCAPHALWRAAMYTPTLAVAATRAVYQLLHAESG